MTKQMTRGHTLFIASMTWSSVEKKPIHVDLKKFRELIVIITRVVTLRNPIFAKYLASVTLPAPMCAPTVI